MRDHISAYETAINKGRREGETKGHARGLKDGTIQTARRMKAKGLTLEFISEMTGLSPEEIALL